MTVQRVKQGKNGSSVVTRKGQITVPSEIRRELGIKEGDRVIFALNDGELTLRTAGCVVEATAGAFKNYGPALTAEELREAAENAIAEDVVERSAR